MTDPGSCGGTTPGETFAEQAERADSRELITWLAAWRARSGLSQAETARRMHTSQSTVARLETIGMTPSYLRWPGTSKPWACLWHSSWQMDRRSHRSGTAVSSSRGWLPGGPGQVSPRRRQQGGCTHLRLLWHGLKLISMTPNYPHWPGTSKPWACLWHSSWQMHRRRPLSGNQRQT